MNNIATGLFLNLYSAREEAIPKILTALRSQGCVYLAATAHICSPRTVCCLHNLADLPNHSKTKCVFAALWRSIVFDMFKALSLLGRELPPSCIEEMLSAQGISTCIPQGFLLKFQPQTAVDCRIFRIWRISSSGIGSMMAHWEPHFLCKWELP
jgi:hypothetical protein